MDIKKTIDKARLYYACDAALIAAFILIGELGGFSGIIEPGTTTHYIVEVASIMITIGALPVAYKILKTQMEKAATKGTEHLVESFLRIYLPHISILVSVVYINTLLHYNGPCNGAIYCAVLGCGAIVYSFPTARMLDKYINREEK